MTTESKPKRTPGSVPRGCDATYRGYLTKDPPQRVALRGAQGRYMVKARMGVNMAAPGVPAEQRSALTEWVDVLALRPAMMERLERCEPCELITVMGPVTLHSWETKSRETRVDRTIVVEYLRACGASVPPRADAGSAAADDELPGPGDSPESGDPAPPSDAVIAAAEAAEAADPPDPSAGD